MKRQRVTLEQEYTELLQTTQPDTTAHSMVHASTERGNAEWVTFLFGVIVGLIASGHTETGFAMIDEGEIFFYPVTGTRRNRQITGRVRIGYDRIERVLGRKNRHGSFPELKLRWRNGNNKRIDVTLGGSVVGVQFPNQQAGLDLMGQILQVQNFEIKPDRSLLRWVLLFVLFFGLIILFAVFYAMFM